MGLFGGHFKEISNMLLANYHLLTMKLWTCKMKCYLNSPNSSKDRELGTVIYRVSQGGINFPGQSNL